MSVTALTSLIGTGMSFLGGMYQNAMQEFFYNKYQSPEARMRQMMEAGINPNAAAQGISGAPAPNMSAAGVASGLGEFVSAIPQLTAEIDKIKSDTAKNKAEEAFFKSQTTGKDLENKYNFETFEQRIRSLNLDNEQKSYIIDTLRPYAENSEQWYKINFDALDEQVKKTRKEIDELDEKIKNLAKERDVMDSQIGRNNADAYEARQRAALERQKKELIDSLGGEDVESAYILARVNGDDKKADTIRKGVQDFVESESKGAFNGDPVHREFQNAQDARDELSKAIDNAIEHQKQLGVAFASGRITKQVYLDKDKEISNLIKELRNSKRSADRAFANQSYKNGYHTWWQDNATSLINTAGHIISAGLISGGLRSKPVNGSTNGMTRGGYGSGRDFLGH